MNPQCQCGELAEWLDIYCQDCWERYCSEEWWKLVNNLSQLNLLTGND